MSFISTLTFIPNFHELYKDIFNWISIIYVKYFINVDQHYCMSLSYFIFWYCIITDFYCNELIMSSLDELTRSFLESAFLNSVINLTRTRKYYFCWQFQCSLSIMGRRPAGYETENRNIGVLLIFYKFHFYSLGPFLCHGAIHL